MSIMSEEEKKAIDTLKEVASDDFDTLGDEISPKMAQNILNVISNQQKEIEELKQIDKHITKETVEFVNSHYISKGTIGEIIEHYNNELEHIKNGEEFENEKPMYYWGKVALENLLEEE